MIDAFEKVAKDVARCPRFDANCTLGDRWEKVCGREYMVAAGRLSQALEASCGKEGRVHVFPVDAGKSRIDVSPQGKYLQVGAPVQDQGLSPDRAGRKPCPGRQRVDGRCDLADQSVTGIFPWQDAVEHETVRQQRGHVLQRVNRAVDLLAQERFLQLLGKKPLAAHIREWPVLDTVTAGSYGDDAGLCGGLFLCPSLRAREGLDDQAGLRDGKGRAAGSDTNGCLHAWKIR